MRHMLVKHDLSHDISHGRVLRQGNNGCHDDLPYEDAIVERWLSKAFMRQGRPPGYRRSVFKALQPNGDAVHSDETAR